MICCVGASGRSGVCCPPPFRYVRMENGLARLGSTLVLVKHNHVSLEELKRAKTFLQTLEVTKV